MSKKKRNTYLYENLSTRKAIAHMQLNDFTTSPPTNTNMVVYESGHKAHCEPGWYTFLRVYDHYLIHYILSGKGTYYTPYGTYQIQEGDLFLIRPDEAIYYIADMENPWTYYWFGFNGNDAFKIMRLCGFTENNPVLYHGEDEKLKELLHKLVYPQFSDLSREYELLGYLYEVFALIIQRQPYPAVSNAEQYLASAISYIEQHFIQSDLRVSDIAVYVGIDRTYLYRIFSDLLHVSVQDFIQQFRLDKAKGLLKFSNTPINQIASTCGFESQAYFSTVFKKYYQMTPLQYRKKEAAEKENSI